MSNYLVYAMVRVVECIIHDNLITLLQQLWLRHINMNIMDGDLLWK